MGVVNESIKDGVGQAAATEELVPIADGQLGSKDGGADAVAFLDGLE